MPQELLKGGSDLFLKESKLLLSLGRILMQTIFAPDFFLIFFLHIIFSLMLMKEYVFVSRNILFLHKLKKEDDLTSASYLHAGHLLSQAK